MGWDTGNDARASAWNVDTVGGGADVWNTGGAAAAGSWGGGDDIAGSWGATGAGGDGGDQTCRVCHQTGHFARDCPEAPAGGGLTGECYNCGEVGHNKADCTNPRVERAFTGTCNGCGVEGHTIRDCPSQKCKLCDQPGHRALECKSRRIVNWTGIPELDDVSAWAALIDAANAMDLDTFRTCLRAYARATMDKFSLPDVEKALREDNKGIYLIAKPQELAANLTIVDLVGNPDRDYVLSFQKFAKPRRVKMAEGWPASPEENMVRLSSAGFVEDRGVPLCGNCGELGHVRKHCKQEQPERQSHQPEITCVNCHEIGHRARDCNKERLNPHACRNCKKDGHNSKDCPEPRSAEGVECRKCMQTGHFSKDCPNVAARTCRNCDSTEHIAKDCDQPKNPDKTQCRNCDLIGHFSRDCPKPRDYSRVKCSNCGDMGHTIKRCKAPIAEDDGDAGGGGWGDVGGTTDAAPAIGTGENSWDTGGGVW
ncbi:hypothetical protein IAQ61_003107 [Plenodomus lingam]|uniref:uncharacterized protein n=1 Tax=Leptosphaeria maculans TaxID=5022 RepID=UPI00331B85FE|nr:hypothetical protein IAQ61_003107 [Plenodomus lingam]